MRRVFRVTSPTNPFWAGHQYPYAGNTMSTSTDKTITMSAPNGDGAHDGRIPISTAGFAIQRLVVASPYKWE
jgi:hypothetical protein